MNKKIWHHTLLVLRWSLGFIFIYAAVGKIANPAAFAADIDNYRILPYLFVPLMAAILPWVELACGLLLISGRWVAGATLLVMMMNLVFIVAMTSALARGLDISCGCFSFSSDSSQVGRTRLVEDAVFFLSAWLLYSYSWKKHQP